MEENPAIGKINITRNKARCRNPKYATEAKYSVDIQEVKADLIKSRREEENISFSDDCSVAEEGTSFLSLFRNKDHTLEGPSQ